MDSDHRSEEDMPESPRGKKMRKRKELDALIERVGKRTEKCEGPERGETSHQDRTNPESTEEEEEIWNLAQPRRKPHNAPPKERLELNTLMRLCVIPLIIACVAASLAASWLIYDIKQQSTSIQKQLDQVSAGDNAEPEKIQKSFSIARLLQKRQMEVEKQLPILDQNLSIFYTEISALETHLSIVEKNLTESPLQHLYTDAKQKVDVAMSGFKTDIIEMQSMMSNMISQQYQMKNTIERMIGKFASFHNDLIELKQCLSVTPSSGPSCKDKLGNLTTEEMKLKIQKLNTTILSQLEQLPYDIQKAQGKIVFLAGDLKYMKSKLLTTLLELKVQNENIKALKHIDVETNEKLSAFIEEIKKLQASLMFIADNV